MDPIAMSKNIAKDNSEMTSMPYYTYLFMLCQALSLIVNMTTVTISAIIGLELAPAPIYATIPYGMQFVGLLVGTYPIALLMRRYGRRFGFMTGAILLAISGFIGFYAISNGNFYLMILAHTIQGIYIATANFYRYAATDGLPEKLRATTISTVVAGGLIGAFIAPEVINTAKNMDGYTMFAACYLAFVVVAGLLMVLMMFIPFEKPEAQSDKDSTAQKAKIDFSKINTPILTVAIVSAGVGYLLMKILMVESALHMKDVGIVFLDASHAIKWHVIGMFGPSLFSGWLINKFGHRTIILTGVWIFLACFALNLVDPNSYLIVTLGLFLLGVAWNFTYVGGSALLSITVKNTPQEKQIQGLGDTIIAAMATVGATLPSILYTTIGWNGTNITALVISTILGVYIVVKYKK